MQICTFVSVCDRSSFVFLFLSFAWLLFANFFLLLFISIVNRYEIAKFGRFSNFISSKITFQSKQNWIFSLFSLELSCACCSTRCASPSRMSTLIYFICSPKREFQFLCMLWSGFCAWLEKKRRKKTRKAYRNPKCLFLHFVWKHNIQLFT